MLGKNYYVVEVDNRGCRAFPTVYGTKFRARLECRYKAKLAKAERKEVKYEIRLVKPAMIFPYND